MIVAPIFSLTQVENGGILNLTNERLLIYKIK